MFYIHKYIYFDTLVSYSFKIGHFEIFWDLSIFVIFSDQNFELLDRLEAIEVIFIIFPG